MPFMGWKQKNIAERVKFESYQTPRSRKMREKFLRHGDKESAKFYFQYVSIYCPGK